MIAITNTENLAGVRVSGDYWDFNELVNALHQVAAELTPYPEFTGARVRLLSTCYNLRIATKGEANIEATQNGISRSFMQANEIILPTENIYFSTEILWPELIFSLICLDDFLTLLHTKDPYIMWKPFFTTIRKFQSKIFHNLYKILPTIDFSWLQKSMLHSTQYTENYIVQYIDILNVEYLKTPVKMRVAALSKLIRKILIKDEAYKNFEKEILQQAQKTKKALYTMPPNFEYPKKIIW